MTSIAKSFAFITRCAPYGSQRPQICLDAALATAVFEQQVNYLFIDDGVYQLLSNQNADSIHSKTLGSAMETLELYGIENVLVDKDSLTARGLNVEDLLRKVELVDREQVTNLLHKTDYVFNL